MITIIRVPDGMKEFPFESGMTVGDVLDAAGWELKDNEEVRVNGRPINGNGLDTELRDLDTVVIVKNIAGNGITIIRVPDGMKEFEFESGMTIDDALDAAGWELKDNEEVRVNGRPINGSGLDTELRDLDTVVIVKNIAGN